MSHPDEITEPLECIDGPKDCEGAVEMRTTPDRQDFKHFARCEHHFDVRMASVARTLELTSPARASWFDEADAGERWDEEY